MRPLPLHRTASSLHTPPPHTYQKKDRSQRYKTTSWEPPNVPTSERREKSCWSCDMNGGGNGNTRDMTAASAYYHFRTSAGFLLWIRVIFGKVLHSRLYLSSNIRCLKKNSFTSAPLQWTKPRDINDICTHASHRYFKTRQVSCAIIILFLICYIT